MGSSIFFDLSRKNGRDPCLGNGILPSKGWSGLKGAELSLPNLPIPPGGTPGASALRRSQDCPDLAKESRCPIMVKRDFSSGIFEGARRNAEAPSDAFGTFKFAFLREFEAGSSEPD